MKDTHVRTLVEIREEMRELVSSGDAEIAHARADDLLVEALRRLVLVIGSDHTLWPTEVEDLITNFRRVEKWYA